MSASMMSSREAAKELGWTVAKVELAVRQGELEGARTYGHVMVKIASVERVKEAEGCQG